jgi:hypothetical protein
MGPVRRLDYRHHSQTVAIQQLRGFQITLNSRTFGVRSGSQAKLSAAMGTSALCIRLSAALPVFLEAI